MILQGYGSPQLISPTLETFFKHWILFAIRQRLHLKDADFTLPFHPISSLTWWQSPASITKKESASFRSKGNGFSWIMDEKRTWEARKKEGTSIKRHSGWLWGLSGFWSAWPATLQESLWNWKKVQLHQGFSRPRQHVPSSCHHMHDMKILVCIERCTILCPPWTWMHHCCCWRVRSSSSFFPKMSWCDCPLFSRYCSRDFPVYFGWVLDTNRRLQTGK